MGDYSTATNDPLMVGLTQFYIVSKAPRPVDLHPGVIQQKRVYCKTKLPTIFRESNAEFLASCHNHNTPGQITLRRYTWPNRY